MSKIHFETKIYKINSYSIIRLPVESSRLLPSRGMVMIKGKINGINFETELEPDGMGSHWFKITDSLTEKIHADAGDSVLLDVETLEAWPEPDVPSDLRNSLMESDLLNQWDSLTVRARWEWIRWIRFTENCDTRNKRIDVLCSMLLSGKRRPCCFDHSRCTDTTVSKSGVLLFLE